jgi:hypothetical protein
MGNWTVYRPKGMTDLEFYRDQFDVGTPEGPGTFIRVLACASKNSVSYLAVQSNSGTEAMIVRFKRHPRSDDFTYNAFEETSDPYYVDCPDRILNQLSPVSELYEGARAERAADWRANVIAHSERMAALPKVKPGDTVVFKDSVGLGRNAQSNTFVLIKGSVFYAVVDGRKLSDKYRISRWKEMEFTVMDTTPLIIRRLKELPAIADADAICLLKAFKPGTRWTWFLQSYDPENDIATGYVYSGLDLSGSFDEQGSVFGQELEAIGVMIDEDFEPTGLSEVEEAGSEFDGVHPFLS